MADLNRPGTRRGQEQQAVSQTGTEYTYLGRFGETVAVLAEVSHGCSCIDDLMREFAERVGEALAADFVQLLEYTPEEDALLLRSGHGFPDSFYNRARVPAGLLSQAGRAMLDPTGRVVELEDFSDPHDWKDDELVIGHGARSGIAVKVEVTGREFGVLSAFYRDARVFSPDEGRLLSYAAALLGAGVERLERIAEVIAWRSRAELMLAGTALLKIPAERDAILSAAALAAVSGGSGGSRPIADWCFTDALEASASLPRLKRVAVDHAEGVAERLEEAFSAPLSPSAPHGAPRAYATRRTELVQFIDAEFVAAVAKSPEHRRAVEEARPYSYMCAPVIGAERFWGAISFLRTETGNPTPYEEEDRDACTEFAALVGDAIERGIPQPDFEESQDAVRPHLSHLDLGLTDREHDVLAGIAAGDRLIKIGHELSISTNTVRTHKRHLCQKLGLSPKSADTEIVAEAKRRGISDLPT